MATGDPEYAHLVSNINKPPYTTHYYGGPGTVPGLPPGIPNHTLDGEPFFSPSSPIDGVVTNFSGLWQNTPTSSQFARLLAILEMTDEERGFVRHALSNPADRPFWLVLGDWLDEQNRQVEAEAVRKRSEGL